MQNNLNPKQPYRIVICVAVLFLSGCAGFQEVKRLDMLDDISTLYERALVAGEYRSASRMTKIDGVHKPPDLDFLKNFQISSYKYLERSFSPDGLTGVYTVEIHYFHTSYLIEKTLEDEQHWEFDSESNRWFLTSGLPQFK